MEIVLSIVFYAGPRPNRCFNLVTTLDMELRIDVLTIYAVVYYKSSQAQSIEQESRARSNWILRTCQYVARCVSAIWLPLRYEWRSPRRWR